MGRVAVLAAVLALSGGLAACGEDGGGDEAAPRVATLVLDFQPNAVHAPLYAAVARGAISRAGVDLDIRAPAGTADGARLLASGRAEFAILDVNDFGIARERGLDGVAIAAIAQRPLASVIAADPEGNVTPADLAGETVGVTGVPSDDAVLNTVLAGAGLGPDAVERTTIGFTAVPALAAGKIAAATAFWNAEGVELRRLGVPTREFRVDESGAPRYPELVLVASGDAADADRDLSCALLEGLSRGYSAVGRDPDAVLEEMLGEVESLDPEAQRAQFAELIRLDAFSPADGAAPSPGLDPRAVRGWRRWATESGVLEADASERLDGAFRTGAVRRCARP